jgi:hypothetical protein
MAMSQAEAFSEQMQALLEGITGVLDLALLDIDDAIRLASPAALSRAAAMLSLHRDTINHLAETIVASRMALEQSARHATSTVGAEMAFIRKTKELSARLADDDLELCQLEPAAGGSATTPTRPESC